MNTTDAQRVSPLLPRAFDQVRAQLIEIVSRHGLLQDGDSLKVASRADRVRSLGAVPSHVDANTSKALRRCLTCAFFQNVAQRQSSGSYLAVMSREMVVPHPSSGLFSRNCGSVIFNELLYTTRLYMRELTQIDAEWLPELVPHFYVRKRRSNGLVD